jgi:hypothetical protein
MSVELEDVPISVIIEGDKTFFASKSAIDRFKKDLKKNDFVKLSNNDYFKEGGKAQKITERYVAKENDKKNNQIETEDEEELN